MDDPGDVPHSTLGGEGDVCARGDQEMAAFQEPTESAGE
jgi:hypothetical protein